MKLITDRNLKQIIIISCCCLCVTFTNCDNKLAAKRSATSIDIQRNPRSVVEPTPSSGRLNREKIPIDDNLQRKNISITKKPEIDTLTSKNHNTSKVSTPGTTIPITSADTRKPGISTNIQPPINTGALLRGASVFLGLSVVVIAYIIFRCARLNKNRTQMVRKYGVLAHRQDVEMRPLPLDDEDEDDTTVFDASEVAAIHDKQRRST